MGLVGNLKLTISFNSTFTSAAVYVFLIVPVAIFHGWVKDTELNYIAQTRQFPNGLLSNRSHASP